MGIGYGERERLAAEKRRRRNKPHFSRDPCLPTLQAPLRLCQETNSLISDSIGVSFPIVDGIPCLVPADGKIVDADQNPDSVNVKDSRQRNSSAEK
ncbi:hypothetical protein DH2020_025605 [Rehmannia glutinosa]|uniref:Uncharacterized protein n=1 Tax=Rehmannia glutinosa TaxID=99300 RepID=A0ABR0W049_REHGL